MSLVLVGLLENELQHLGHWVLITRKSALWSIIKFLFCLCDADAYQGHIEQRLIVRKIK